MDFEQRITTMLREGWLLSEAKQWVPIGDSYTAPGAFRVWLNHKAWPSYCHGLGWGPSLSDALAAAEAEHYKMREKCVPKTSRPFISTLTLDDLNL